MTVLAGIMAALVTVGAATWWVAAGAHGPIERTRLDAIPPYVLNTLTSDARARVLAIDLSHGDARYSVLSGDQVRLGDADRGFAFGGSAAAADRVDDLVVRLVAGTADSDISPQLRELGIGSVWVAGADSDEQSRIDNTPGLGTASGNERATVWQIAPAVSRATVSDADQQLAVGSSPATIPPGTEGRRLRLGEPLDRRWRAELDGRRLTPVDDGWQQAFVLPAAGGRLTYDLPGYRSWLLVGQGVILVLAAVLAAPGIRRPEVRDPTRSARRAATLSELI
jgi:hypothetical protein